jgi:hypothetical protein
VSAADERPHVCEDQILLPLDLLVRALAMEPTPGAAEMSDVEEAPTCIMQRDHGGAHYGIVLSLDGPSQGAVWAVWTALTEAQLVILPDCSGTEGMEACSSFDAHPGGHSWELYDPLMAFVRQVMDGAPIRPAS